MRMDYVRSLVSIAHGAQNVACGPNERDSSCGGVTAVASANAKRAKAVLDFVRNAGQSRWLGEWVMEEDYHIVGLRYRERLISDERAGGWLCDGRIPLGYDENPEPASSSRSLWCALRAHRSRPLMRGLAAPDDHDFGRRSAAHQACCDQVQRAQHRGRHASNQLTLSDDKGKQFPLPFEHAK